MGKRVNGFIFYGLMALVLAGGLFLAWERLQYTRPLPAGARIIARTHYRLCNHDVDTNANLPAKTGYNTLDLLGLYPVKQGWSPVFSGGGVTLTRMADGLCPDCQKKSHLGEKGGFLAVIRGPAGINGGIIRVTTIRLSSLPAEYQDQARRGLLDLPDEVALLQVLDSLDEASKE